MANSSNNSSPTATVSSIVFQTVTITNIATDTGVPTVTLTGPTVTIATTFLTDHATVSLGQISLLTGTCTMPYIAQVTDSLGSTILYPQIGCSPARQNCCPFPFQANVSVVDCPEDYESVSAAGHVVCCPRGYTLFPLGIAHQTPCYSNLSTVLLPTVSPNSNITVESTRIFAWAWPLVTGDATNPVHPPPSPQSHWSSASTAGLVVGLVVGVILVVALLHQMYRRRVRARPTGHTHEVSGSPARTSSPGEVVQVGMLPAYVEHDRHRGPRESTPAPVELPIGDHPCDRSSKDRSSTALEHDLAHMMTPESPSDTLASIPAPLFLDHRHKDRDLV